MPWNLIEVVFWPALAFVWSRWVNQHGHERGAQSRDEEVDTLRLMLHFSGRDPVSPYIQSRVGARVA